MPKHLKLRLLKEQINSVHSESEDIGSYLESHETERSSEAKVSYKFELIDGNYLMMCSN